MHYIELILFGSLGGAIAVLIYNRLEQLQNKEEKQQARRMPMVGYVQMN